MDENNIKTKTRSLNDEIEFFITIKYTVEDLKF